MGWRFHSNFWRWPLDSICIARDGIVPFIMSHLPQNKKAPQKIKAIDRAKLVDKILTYIKKGYRVFTSEELVHSYIDFFAVSKGLDDIRMVLNGSLCGLNLAIFACNFWLPMSATMTRLLSFGYRVVDMDIGEMFPNFPLHHSLWKCSGMDLTTLRGTLGDVTPSTLVKSRRLTATWSRL